MRHLKRRRNISQCSCVVVIILSHGCDEEIEGSDNKRVALKDVTKYLSDKNCSPLEGKPKVFIVQACRGRDVLDTTSVSSDMVGMYLDSDSSYTVDSDSLYNMDSDFLSTGGISQDGTDMLVAFATMPDHIVM